MKLINVERRLPESFYECDQLLALNSCRACAYSDYKGPVCKQREIFLNIAVKAGILEKCTDSNGETFYRRAY